MIGAEQIKGAISLSSVRAQKDELQEENDKDMFVNTSSII